MIATATFLPYDELSGAPASKAEWIEHSARISMSFIREQIKNGNSALDGAFDATGVTPATVTRLEALLSERTRHALESLPIGIVISASRRAG